MLALFVVAALADCHDIIASRYPKQYVAYKTDTPPVLDGKLDDPMWTEVPFTDSFVDISTIFLPSFTTQSKIRFDDEWLYVGIYVQDTAVWANITYTCHCINPNEDQVIFHGNDVEVFVDADASCWYYKEFEINAANASWDTCLDRPYADGGYENSTRVLGKHGFDLVPPLRSAIYTDGILNDPRSHPTYWSVELAMPLSKLTYNTTANNPPNHGDFWRLNFMRAEWTVAVHDNRYWLEASCQTCPNPGQPVSDNWVWSPMHAIDMHRPEMWGIIQFSTDAVNTTTPVYYEEWPQRYVAHQLYYAQRAYADAHRGSFAESVFELKPYAEFPDLFQGNCTKLPTIDLAEDRQSYTASIASAVQGEPTVTITNLRHVLSHP